MSCEITRALNRALARRGLKKDATFQGRRRYPTRQPRNPPKQPNSLNGKLRALLADRSRTWDVQQLLSAIEPTPHKPSMLSALSAMVFTGEIERVERGVYRGKLPDGAP